MDLLKCNKKCRYYEEPSCKGFNEVIGYCKLSGYIWQLTKKEKAIPTDYTIGWHGDNDDCEIAKALIVYEKIKNVEKNLIDKLIRGDYDRK